MKIKGVITALITPFTQSGEVDYEGLRANIRFQIEQGVSGILPLGTTGETPTLTREEQDEIIKISVEEAKGKVLVMVGTGTNSTKTTIKYTQRAQELGADMALVVTPYYNKPTQEGIYQHFKAVTQSVSLPVMIYNIQGRTGKNIETSTMQRIAALPNVVSVKEASGDVNQMGDVLSSIANDSFTVMSGDDGLTLPLLSLGGMGVVSVVSNLVPGKVVEMVNSGLSGNFTKARELHLELLPLFKGAFIESNPQPIKYLMARAGMAAGPCRLPLMELSVGNKPLLDDLLRKMELLQNG